MGDQAVLERISAWQADGIIDAALATRLRSAEDARPAGAVPAQAATGGPGPSAAAAMFGPSVTIAEMFGYLGTLFILGAWYASISRIAGTSGDPAGPYFIGGSIAAAALAILGVRLASGSRRQRRAAGALFVVAAANVGWAAWSAGQLVFPIGAVAIEVVAAAAGLIAALAFRRVHPGLLTQFALLSAVVTLSTALLDGIDQLLYPRSDLFAASGPDSAIRVVLAAVWWALTAAVLGLIGLGEAGAGTPAADRRAALSRFAAGLTAVSGIAIELFATGNLGNGEYGRLIEPALADLAILVVGAVLLERAFRREAASYVYPAGLAVIVALSDLNANYLARETSTEIGLLVEGAILLAVGLGFDRLRRRVSGTGAPVDATPDPPSPAAPEGDVAATPAST